jgi:predicted ATPase
MLGLLDIRVLGDFHVGWDGNPIGLPPSKKTRALLAYLAVTGRSHRRERLCELFWDVPDDPRGALRWSLSKIRQILGRGSETCLVADRNTVTLTPDAVKLDFARARTLHKDDLSSRETAELEEIAALYRGGFLADLSLPRCPDFEAWRIALANEVDLGRIRLLQELIRRFAEAPERALRYGHALQSIVSQNSQVAKQVEALGEAALQRALKPDAVIAQATAIEAQTRVSDREILHTDQTITSTLMTPVTTDETRKQVSVLVVEIVLPLLARDETDPEVFLEAIEPLLDLATNVAEQRGGTIVTRGQADLTAIFGAVAPVEDHALQAAQTALCVSRAIQHRANQVTQVKAAIDTGEAIVRARTLPQGSRIDVNGPPVRVAQRMAQASRQEIIIATARTREAAGGFLIMEPLDASADLSPEREQQVYRVVGENQALSRWQLRAGQRLTPLIGREAELRTICQAWQRAQQGQGQVVGLVAGAGLGKSRLAHEFVVRQQDNGAVVLESGALEADSNASFIVLKRLLHSLLGVGAGAPAEAVAAKLTIRLRERGADAGVLSPLLFVLDLPIEDREWNVLSAADRARRARDATAVLLSLEAQQEPIVVLIEDLHWVDPESEAAITRIVASISHQSILLLATYRPEYRHDWLQRGSFLQVGLDQLGLGNVDAFLRSLIGDDPSVSHLIPLVAERTGGVPLFMEEVVRSLVQSGQLVGQPGSYSAREAITKLEVPATVQSVIAARIGQLQERDRWALQIAAVIGREIPVGMLGRITGFDHRELESSLTSLQRAGFITEKQVFPVSVYVFRHSLIEDVAYRSLVGSTRRGIHGRVLELMEIDYAEHLEEILESLSEHAVRAESWITAVDYLLRAARRALQRSAHQTALAFLGRGLAITARWPETAERFRIELQYQETCGVAWMAAKGWGAREVSEAYERAEALCHLLDDRTELFTVLRGRAQYYMISGQPESAQKIAENCAKTSLSSPDNGVAIETHHMFWTNGFFMGDYVTAGAHAEQAIGRYQPDRDHHLTFKYSGHDPGVCSRCMSGLVLWQQGHLERATIRCTEAVQLAEKLAHPLTTALAYWGMSYLHMFRREPDLALLWAEREIEVCDEYMLPLLRSQGVFQVGWATAQLGELALGIEQMEQGVQAIRATGAEMGLPYFLGLLGETYSKAQEGGKALAMIGAAIESAGRNGARFQLSELLRMRADVLTRGRYADPDEVERTFRAAIESARNQGAVMPELRAATRLAGYFAETERLAEARELLRSYSDFIRTTPGCTDIDAAAELL